MEKNLQGVMEKIELLPILEKQRKETIEHCLEYELNMLQNFKNNGKNIDDVIEYVKIALWNIKNQRAERIKKDLEI